MCLNKIYKNYSFEDGKYRIDWKSTGFPDLDKPAIGIKCGNCPECWQQASAEWATRCYLESKHYAQNCIVTLTYNDEHCDNELHKRDYQLFLKRLRKAISPVRIKYFCSGEYGTRYGRPHYHIIIFGWCPADLRFLKKSDKGSKLYDSAMLASVWGKGFITVDPALTQSSCFYSAKYLQKALSNCGVLHKQEPFVAMSKGIAEREAVAYDPLKDDYIYVSGKKYRPPRYFRKIAKKLGKDIPYVVQKWCGLERKHTDVLNVPLYMLKNSQIRAKREAKLASNQAKWELFYKKLGVTREQYLTIENAKRKIKAQNKLCEVTKCQTKNVANSNSMTCRSSLMDDVERLIITQQNASSIQLSFLRSPVSKLTQ